MKKPDGGLAQDQTRRQWLAGLAMQEMIAGLFVAAQKGADPVALTDLLLGSVPASAYGLADAMLAFEAAEEKP